MRANKAAALLVLILLACGEVGPAAPPPPPEPVPTSLIVNPSTSTLEALGQTVQLTAEVRDQNGSVMPGVAVTWTSGDAGVATVSATGLVVAVRNGNAAVTAQAGNATATAAVVVEQKADAVRLAPDARTFRALGDTLRLSAEALDANGHLIVGAGFAWSSDDEAVVAVDGGGLVTALENGRATVTAAAGDASAGAVFTVRQEAVSLRLSAEALVFRALGDTLRLSTEGFDANGHAVVGVAWSSSDTAVATVNATGLVTAAGNGTARITAAAGRTAARAVVSVEQEAVSLGGLPAVDTLIWYNELGDTLRLTPVAFDANEHPIQDVRFGWLSSNSAVARVDASGLVRGAAEGMATITATSGNLRIGTELAVVNRDRATLVAFYHATDGSNWRYGVNWSSPNMEDWYGVGTRRREDSVVVVTTLALGGLDIGGRIPPELGNLANLEELGLDGNRLSGPIPPELGNLENLEGLDLSSNELSGPIPPQLGNLANLSSVWLYANELSGPIPPELGDLANLSSLRLHDNELGGPIPPWLGDLASLKELVLGGNAFVGEIPPELGNLANLLVLILANNPFTGPLPQTLTQLAPSQFSWHGTRLCAPGNAAFQRWLRSIEFHHGGETCR